MTITEFLLARIAEDEEFVDRRGAFPHSIHSFDIIGTFSPHCPDCLGLPGRARVLAECAAKRAILGLHAAFGRSSEVGASAGWLALGEALKDLARVYEDHPEYKETWAV